jgi:hypothetical protein
MKRTPALLAGIAAVTLAALTAVFAQSADFVPVTQKMSRTRARTTG